MDKHESPNESYFHFYAFAPKANLQSSSSDGTACSGGHYSVLTLPLLLLTSLYSLLLSTYLPCLLCPIILPIFI